MFSVFSFEPFEGGEKNLLLSLQQKPEQISNVVLEKIFSVFVSWYAGKDNALELDKVNFYFYCDIIYIYFVLT